MRIRTALGAAVLAAGATLPLAGLASAADLDCDDVSQEEAQRILDADPSDPNRFDADDDGQACDSGAGGGSGGASDGDSSAPSDEQADQVDVTPQGGVETGDGSGGAADMSSVLGALGLTAAGGLAVAARRTARQGG